MVRKITADDIVVISDYEHRYWFTFCTQENAKNVKGCRKYSWEEWRNLSFNVRQRVKKVTFHASMYDFCPENLEYFFGNMNHLKQVNGLAFLNTSKVQSMKQMFYRCRRLKEIDVSYFQTQNVTDMSYMFLDCFSVEKLDCSHFDFSSARDLTAMFKGCHLLGNLKLPAVELPGTCLVRNIFEGCYSLELGRTLKSYNLDDLIEAHCWMTKATASNPKK